MTMQVIGCIITQSLTDMHGSPCCTDLADLAEAVEHLLAGSRHDADFLLLIVAQQDMEVLHILLCVAAPATAKPWCQPLN